MKPVERGLDPRTRLMLGANPDGSLSALLDDCADAAVDLLAPSPVWARSDFDRLRRRIAVELPGATAEVVSRVQRVLIALQAIQVALPEKPTPAQIAAVTDIRRQLEELVPPHFVTATGANRLADLARYLTAIGRRLERLPHGLAADADRMQRVHAVEQAYRALVSAVSPCRAAAEDVRDIARMIQELRVSLWAQQLGTARPVSEQRIYRAIDEVTL